MLTVRPMQPEDLSDVARIHKGAYLRDHATAHFSERLLSALYGAYLEAGAWCFVAVHHGHAVGFVVGGPTEALARGMQTFRRHHRWSIALTALATPAIWPVACRRVRSAVTRRRRRGLKPAARQAPQHLAHLLSIAVAQQYQGTGVAHDLAEAFADDVKRRGYEKYLASVREDNVHSQNFFASLGARRQYAKEGIVSFTIDLGSPCTPGPSPRRSQREMAHG